MTNLTKAHSLDAGWDLVATHDAVVGPEAVTKIHTGVMGDVPQGHVGFIWPRSGLAVNAGIEVLAGVIDASYRGEIIVALTKRFGPSYPVRKGDRIAQLVIVPLSAYVPGATSERGEGGFGSSGA